ncbi:hypothetical protein EVAR_82170_1 [Eumeta japonica]|uniref:Uncharacterized protein n=1 Tax=Eumeta variegata TaxID=151549 RepID=A0A4C1U1R4_EUMVA|nr:hypothetical protein EVAR_82170_1 [Eumeta japonica]
MEMPSARIYSMDGLLSKHIGIGVHGRASARAGPERTGGGEIPETREAHRIVNHKSTVIVGEETDLDACGRTQDVVCIRELEASARCSASASLETSKQSAWFTDFQAGGGPACVETHLETLTMFVNEAVDPAWRSEISAVNVTTDRAFNWLYGVYGMYGMVGLYGRERCAKFAELGRRVGAELRLCPQSAGADFVSFLDDTVSELARCDHAVRTPPTLSRSKALYCEGRERQFNAGVDDKGPLRQAVGAEDVGSRRTRQAGVAAVARGAGADHGYRQLAQPDKLTAWQQCR